MYYSSYCAVLTALRVPKCFEAFGRGRAGRAQLASRRPSSCSWRRSWRAGARRQWMASCPDCEVLHPWTARLDYRYCFALTSTDYAFGAFESAWCRWGVWAPAGPPWTSGRSWSSDTWWVCSRWPSPSAASFLRSSRASVTISAERPCCAGPGTLKCRAALYPLGRLPIIGTRTGPRRSSDWPPANPATTPASFRSWTWASKSAVKCETFYLRKSLFSKRFILFYGKYNCCAD